MLVLSRQRDESLVVGDDLEVAVVDIRGDKVRLGLYGPETHQIYRKELYDAILADARSGKGAPAFRPAKGTGALVLSRQRSETIVVIAYDDLKRVAADASFRPPLVQFTVVDIRGDKVRIGVDAPKEVSVHRKEVWQAIRRERNLDVQAPADADAPEPGNEKHRPCNC